MRSLIAVGLVGPEEFGKATIAGFFAKHRPNTIRTSFGDLAREDLLDGDFPEAFIWNQIGSRIVDNVLNELVKRDLLEPEARKGFTWSSKPEPHGLLGKKSRASALKQLGYSPSTNPERSMEIYQSYVTFILDRFGPSYFINRMDSHIRTLREMTHAGRSPVLVVISDVQLVELADWIRFHVPLTLGEESAYLIKVWRGRNRKRPSPSEGRHGLITVASQDQSSRITGDRTIRNVGTLRTLEEEVRKIANDICRSPRPHPHNTA